MSVNSVIEETRKRPRLNWGEGLAKLEKKKTKGDGVSATTIATTDSGAFSSFTGSLLSCQQLVTPGITHRDIEDGTYEWTNEKTAFLQVVLSFGENFRMTAWHVGIKSKDQCKKFSIKGQKSHRLDLMRHRLENIGSLLNEINHGRSTNNNDACIEEADSIIDNDKLGIKTNDDQPSSAVNLSHDKSKPMEARNLSVDFKEIDREFDHQDKNMISNTYNWESKLVDTNGCGVVLFNFDKSSSVKDKRDTTMTDIMEVRKDKVGDAFTKLVLSASEIIEPCYSYSVAEDRLSVMLTSFPTWLDDKDGKNGGDIDDDAVELKNQSHDSNTKVNTCLSSVVVSCSTLTFGVENQPKLFLKNSSYSGPSMEDPLPTSNSMLQNTASVVHAIQKEKSTTRDGLSLKEPVKKQV
ncbi:hypothetical protein JHK87_047672 [Glycine soja]|nr:hypothetical protein JHK87_047672 [Glycine soja]